VPAAELGEDNLLKTKVNVPFTAHPLVLKLITVIRTSDIHALRKVLCWAG
jgi:hypothetical protein